MIVTLFLLWKMLRRLHLAPPPGAQVTRAVEFRIIVEPEDSWRRRCAYAEKCGEEPPPREWMHEVSWWPIAGQPCQSQRGETLAVALRKALAAPFPAEM